jgi:hypothetical protein
MGNVSRAEPKHKGVGVLPVVMGIKANPNARARVPTHLASYMSDPIVATGWYPERDYHTLITLLASTIDPKQVGGDVWAFFGRTAAQRDIGGAQEEVPERSRLPRAGLYRTYRDVAEHDLTGLFSRMSRVWGLYHDSGKMVFMRHPDKADGVVLRLLDFAFPVQGLADLQTAYLLEYALLSGFSMSGGHVASWESGTEWRFALPSQAGFEQSIMTMQPWEPMSHTHAKAR